MAVMCSAVARREIPAAKQEILTIKYNCICTNLFFRVYLELRL